jgi:hypothetical protein
MVVLAATFTSTNPDLHNLISEAELLRLMDRTIKFLKLSDDISPVLKYDAEILQTVRANLFPAQASSSKSSFSGR